MSNTLLKLYLTEKDFGCKKNDKDNVGIVGATNKVATLKEAVSAAERNAAGGAHRARESGGAGGGGTTRAPGSRGKT